MDCRLHLGFTVQLNEGTRILRGSEVKLSSQVDILANALCTVFSVRLSAIGSSLLMNALVKIVSRWHNSFLVLLPIP